MAVEVERLVAILEARVDKWEKNLAKAHGTADRTFHRIERRGKQFEQRLAGIGSAAFVGFAKGAALALAPIISVTAAVNTAKAALQEFGDIADSSKAAGLDAEFFQELAYGAGLAGVEIGSLSGALSAFNRNSGLAVVNKGKMVGALKSLNPELLANIQAARTQEERIRLVADAIDRASTASQKAALATAAFGEAGAGMVQVFEGGSAALDETARKARELGVVIDRDLIARADELGDEFDTATKVMDLQFKQALINLAPTLIWLAQLAGGLAGAINGIVQAMSSVEQQSTDTLEQRLEGLDREISQARVERPEGVTTGMDPEVSVEDLDEMLATRAAIFEELKRRALDVLRGQLAAGLVGEEGDAPGRDGVADAAIRQGEAVKALIADLQFENAIMGESAVQQEVLTTLRRLGVDAMSEEGQEIAALIRQKHAQIEANDALKESEEALAEIMGEIGDIGKDAINSAVDALKDGVVTAEEFNDILGDIVKKMLDLGVDLIMGALGGGDGIDLSSLFSGKANGGPVQAGRPYIVGEKRPELFVPSTAGRIIPRVPTMGGRSGSGPVTLIVNVSGAKGNAEIMDMARAGAHEALTTYRKSGTLQNDIMRTTKDPYARGNL